MLTVEKEYQNIAIKNLTNKISGFLNDKKNDKDENRMLTILKAPTGSGKTFMASQIITKLNNEIDTDVTFVWLSIGSGAIHLQSKESLENYFGESPKVKLIESVCVNSRSLLLKGEVVVINWEKIRTKDRNREWKNIAMKDGDNVNFREILDNTQKIRTKIVLIIDESHIGANSERGAEIIELIKPNVILEISATPKLHAGGMYQEMYTETVKPQDVIDQEMIKNQIILNEYLISEKGKEVDTSAILKTAYNKRLELKRLYEKLGSCVNPLVLIQIPNSEAGNAKREEAEKFLKEQNIDTDNKKLAVWLSDDKDKLNLPHIKDIDGMQEFLIFKEAVATGWDCPRAQILVKYRETKSEEFEIQILGRILRMPEQKHYTESALNKAYIYTNLGGAKVDIEEYNPKILGDLCITRSPLYNPINLTSYYRSRADYQDIRADFYDIFYPRVEEFFGIKENNFAENTKQLKKKNFKIDAGEVRNNIFYHTTIEAKEIDKLEKISGNNLDIKHSDVDISIIFQRKLEECIHPFTNIVRSTGILRSAWYQLYKKYIDRNLSDNIVNAQKIFLNNQDIIMPLIKNIVSDYEKVKIKKTEREREKIKNNWNIKEVDYLSSQVYEKVDYNNCVMEPCYVSKNRSNPEKEFEIYINSQKNVKWWYKNNTLSDDYFGIRYEYDNKDDGEKIHTAYPDYLVQYNDGRVGIFEVKDRDDPEHLTWTKAKAEAISKYIEIENKKGKKLLGGIVVNKDNGYSLKEWKLNSKKKFELYNEKDWAKI